MLPEVGRKSALCAVFVMRRHCSCCTVANVSRLWSASLAADLKFNRTQKIHRPGNIFSSFSHFSERPGVQFQQKANFSSRGYYNDNDTANPTTGHRLGVVTDTVTTTTTNNNTNVVNPTANTTTTNNSDAEDMGTTDSGRRKSNTSATVAAPASVTFKCRSCGEKNSDAVLPSQTGQRAPIVRCRQCHYPHVFRHSAQSLSVTSSHRDVPDHLVSCVKIVTDVDVMEIQ